MVQRGFLKGFFLAIVLSTIVVLVYLAKTSQDKNLPDPNMPRPLPLGDPQPAPTACPPKLKFSKGLPKTALFSAPGCGNTWVRHLIQQTTGEQGSTGPGIREKSWNLGNKVPGICKLFGNVIKF